MTANGRRERRHAEAFAAASDAAPIASELDRDVAVLVRLSETLREAGAESPRPEFVQDLRTRLLSEATATRRPQAPVRRDSGQRHRLGLMAAAFAVTGASVGVITQSAQALPGDALYPIKRGVENAEVALERNPGAAGSSRLTLADTRLDEVMAITAGNEDSLTAAVAIQTLEDFSAQAEQGADSLMKSYADHGDDTALARITSFTQTSSERLAALSGDLPDSASAAYAAASETLRSLNAMVEEVCNACPVPSLTDLPATLLTPQELVSSDQASPDPDESKTPDSTRMKTPTVKSRNPKSHLADPDETPTDPSEPSQPSEPSEPSEPSAPSDTLDEVTKLVDDLTDPVAERLFGHDRTNDQR